MCNFLFTVNNTGGNSEEPSELNLRHLNMHSGISLGSFSTVVSLCKYVALSKLSRALSRFSSLLDFVTKAFSPLLPGRSTKYASVTSTMYSVELTFVLS